MLLGLDNSRARGRPKQPLTRVAFYSSYWIDNRTGMDLMFQDHAAAQANPFLLGARMPGAYAEVLVPGMPFWVLDTTETVMFNSRRHTRACGYHIVALSQVGGMLQNGFCMLGMDPGKVGLIAALPRAVTERGVLETWDVQSAEEIPVASVLLNTQVRTIRVPYSAHCRLSKQFEWVVHHVNGYSHLPIAMCRGEPVISHGSRLVCTYASSDITVSCRQRQSPCA